MSVLGKYLNNQNWNIGFACTSPEELLRDKKLNKVHWMKHPYRDRFFADPFILSSDENAIKVLAEELIFGGKGVIVCLTVDPHTFQLLEREVLLSLDTHLSYPFIDHCNGQVYVCPENYESGRWKSYTLAIDGRRLIPDRILCDEPLTDATILDKDGSRYLISTAYPSSLQDAYLYRYDETDYKYQRVSETPVVNGKKSSRMGGSFFEAGGKTYRPAQNCSGGYGRSLIIFEVESITPEYRERPIFELKPQSWRYNLGLHTLNFSPDRQMAVIDSYGYLYPLAGRLLMLLYKFKHLF